MDSNLLINASEPADTIAKRLNELRFSGERKVVALLEKPAPGIHAARESVEVVAGQGFTGDHQKKDFWKGARISGREVTVVSQEVLSELGVNYLTIGDNLVCTGINLSSLAPGQELCIGTVRLQRAEKTHRPCSLFAQRTSLQAMEAVKETSMRGALFYVAAGGRLSLNDVIELKS